MHLRYNANIDNKTYVGERDLQKVIRCLLTYGNQFIRHNWKPFFIKILKLKFHGILYHFKTQCIDDTYGSIE